jgi:YVTN family beta-propeller protein
MVPDQAIDRRALLSGAAATAVLAAVPGAQAQTAAGAAGADRVYICNEDSNTLSIIDPATNTVAGTVNLTSFDEDPRPPSISMAPPRLPTIGSSRRQDAGRATST